MQEGARAYTPQAHAATQENMEIFSRLQTMNMRTYYIKAGLMALLLSPVVVSTGLLIGIFTNNAIMIVISPIPAFIL